MCDHKPLSNFLIQRTKNEMVNRWSLLIQEFNIEFRHVCSDDNVSDFLSRLGDCRPDKSGLIPEVDFPAWPQRNETHDAGVQVNAVAVLNRSNRRKCSNGPEGLAFPAQPLVRRDATAEEEAKLMGVMNRLTILDITNLSDAQVQHMQANDSYCTRIMTNYENFREENGCFMMKQGLLYRVFNPQTPGRERLPSLALVIPQSLALTVLLNLHKELCHAGRDKMLAVLYTRVYWKKMRVQTAEFVKGCRICQYRHLANSKYPAIRIKPPSGPGLRVAVDCWSGDRHGITLLTAIDLFSQYPYAKIIPSKTSRHVVRAFMEIYTDMPTIRCVLCDNGSEFTSDDFKSLLRSRGIRQDFLGPNAPRGNGILEKWHRYLNEVFRLSTNLSNASYDAAVRGALEAYRKLPHTSSGESPVFLHSGREPTYCIDHLLPTRVREVWDEQRNRLNLDEIGIAYGIARKNLCLARKRSKAKVKVLDRPLQVGDRVYRQNMSSSKSKTDLKWLPGYRIVRMESSRTAVVEHTHTGVKSRVSVDYLRWADPVSELILNSNIDTFPGESKLYFSADDFQDLNWEAIEQVDATDVVIDDKMNEIIRNRASDLCLQKSPNKTQRLNDSTRFPVRERRRNTRLRDYIVGFIAACSKQTCLNRISHSESVSDKTTVSLKRWRDGVMVTGVAKRKTARACEGW
jgi:transposase InsO family protein